MKENKAHFYNFLVLQAFFLFSALYFLLLVSVSTYVTTNIHDS